MKLTDPPLATVLTIAGSDSSAGAGLQADLKTIHALNGYALTAATAITAQNGLGVSAVYPLAAEVVKSQLEALFSDYEIQAVKIGMLGNRAILETVITCLKQANVKHIVLDTVLVSSSGKPLLEIPALPLFINELLPLATVITPNLPELNVLLNRTEPSAFKGKLAEMNEIGQLLFALGVKTAVIKGGHSSEAEATDYLLTPDNSLNGTTTIEAFSSKRLKVTNSHGTGCTYASAIATELAKGKSLSGAVKEAKDYLFSSLESADQGQACPRQQEGKLLKERKGGLNHFSTLIQRTDN